MTREEGCYEVYLHKKEPFERTVKLGDPFSKFEELADKLDIELIMMGSTGVEGSDQDL
jgi:nucleotide-binding universal stress UspA family protein